MDQTPLPFAFSEGNTYADRGEQTLWVRGAASGLDKRRCTVQLTIFADGIPRVKPLLIFRGKGKHMENSINLVVFEHYMLSSRYNSTQERE